MSTIELFNYLENNPWYVVAFAAGLPLLSLLLRIMHGPYKAPLRPWKYLYSILIHLSCIPGIFVAFSGVYLATFQRQNLLSLDLVSFALPVLSMIITLIIIRRSIRFDEVPGFRRIAGLIAITIATFAVLLILDRLRIILFFHASILWFLLIGAGLFIALRIGGRLIFGRSRVR